MTGHARQIFIQERKDGGQTTLRFTVQAPVSKKLQGLAAASHDVNPVDRQIASQDAHRRLGTGLLEIAEQDIGYAAGQAFTLTDGLCQTPAAIDIAFDEEDFPGHFPYPPRQRCPD
jgi:hypothetical protein